MDPIPTYKPEKYNWLKAQRQIELLNLENEVMRIPVLLQECGEITSTAIEIRESAKDELDRIKSIVASDIRKEGHSETAIASMVPSDERYINAVAQLSEARLDAGLWNSLMDSLRTKSSGLRVIADLIASGFVTQASIMQKRRQELRQSP